MRDLNFRNILVSFVTGAVISLLIFGAVWSLRTYPILQNLVGKLIGLVIIGMFYVCYGWFAADQFGWINKEKVDK
jgi:hypothetical protein